MTRTYPHIARTSRGPNPTNKTYVAHINAGRILIDD